MIDGDENVIEFSLAGRPFNASALTFVVDWDMDEVCVCVVFDCNVGYLLLPSKMCLQNDSLSSFLLLHLGQPVRRHAQTT